MPDTANSRPALPPGPWRIEPIPRRKDLRVVAPNGSLLAEVTGPDKAAVAALLVRAREVEDAAREVEETYRHLRIMEEETGRTYTMRVSQFDSLGAAILRLRAALGDEG